MEFKNCESQKLELDQACVVFINKNSDFNSWIYALASDCVLCPFRKIAYLKNDQNTSIIFNSQKSWIWWIINGTNSPDYKSPIDKSDVKCEIKAKLGEYGIYQVLYDSTCNLKTIKQPSNSYIPLVILIGVLVLFFSLISLGKIIFKRWRKNLSSKNDIEVIEKPSKKRIQSVDTFRGMSILTMIFVNNGAGGYEILEHATWNGLYVGDLVFPCFLWIMGVCIPIALNSQLSRGVSKLSIIKNIIKRSCILFFLGLCLNTLGTDSNLEHIRIFGVLQRFGVAYLIVALSYTLLNSRISTKFEHGVFSYLNDIISLLSQWIFIICILIVHCVITFCLKVPGCPTGYLGPGGLHEEGKYFNCTGGSAGYIDRLILGNNHLYQYSSISSVYQAGPFDPEGILGCFTTIIQAFLGVQAGTILRVYKDWRSRTMRWLILAVIYACIGVILHFSSYVPVNKNLWSISFVFITTSFALAVFTACYLLIDVVQLWNGGPFRIPGMNALVMYIGHQMCYQIFPFHWKYGLMNSHTWKTIAALWDTGCWTVIAYVLHHKRIYVSL
ncbi:heparan-alpha-glucosaminide N-acetyltransferase-like [Chelonus insularis]|uniref:heparan-alpha-glucosaminide N-acetyltransferase-like n=1 Tax=Chelonus insularis TaxID=460826 RepID=UPI00158EF62F|nr:heparan-alpha-glucosaminide N-acetyltransferase-like [Chelonus insularis]